jgi:hypothetical protein
MADDLALSDGHQRHELVAGRTQDVYHFAFDRTPERSIVDVSNPRDVLGSLRPDPKVDGRAPPLD